MGENALTPVGLFGASANAIGLAEVDRLLACDGRAVARDI